MIYHHPQDMCTNIPRGMHIPRVWGVSQCSVWSFLTNNDTRPDFICSELSTHFWGTPSGSAVMKHGLQRDGDANTHWDYWHFVTFGGSSLLQQWCVWLNQKGVTRPMAICVYWVIKKMCLVLCIFPMPTFPRLSPSLSLWALENFLTLFGCSCWKPSLFLELGRTFSLDLFTAAAQHVPESQTFFSLHKFQPLLQFQPPLLMELSLPGEPLVGGVEQTTQQHWLLVLDSKKWYFPVFWFCPCSLLVTF